MSRHRNIRAAETFEAPTRTLESKSGVGRLTYRLDDLAEALGISRRSLERERSAGRLPRPDLTIGKMPLWTVETVRSWIETGGKGVAR